MERSETETDRLKSFHVSHVPGVIAPAGRQQLPYGTYAGHCMLIRQQTSKRKVLGSPARALAHRAAKGKSDKCKGEQ